MFEQYLEKTKRHVAAYADLYLMVGSGIAIGYGFRTMHPPKAAPIPYGTIRASAETWRLIRAQNIEMGLDAGKFGEFTIKPVAS